MPFVSHETPNHHDFQPDVQQLVFRYILVVVLAEILSNVILIITASTSSRTLLTKDKIRLWRRRVSAVNCYFSRQPMPSVNRPTYLSIRSMRDRRLLVECAAGTYLLFASFLSLL
jgi:hypothetical protein